MELLYNSEIVSGCISQYYNVDNSEVCCYIIISFYLIVKLLDWGQDGVTIDAETAALRASFQQEVAVWHRLDHPNVTKVKIEIY